MVEVKQIQMKSLLWLISGVVISCIMIGSKKSLGDQCDCIIKVYSPGRTGIYRPLYKLKYLSCQKFVLFKPEYGDNTFLKVGDTINFIDSTYFFNLNNDTVLIWDFKESSINKEAGFFISGNHILEYRMLGYADSVFECALIVHSLDSVDLGYLYQFNQIKGSSIGEHMRNVFIRYGLWFYPDLETFDYEYRIETEGSCSFIMNID